MRIYIVLGVSIALAACGTVTEPPAPTQLAPAATPETALRHASTLALLAGYVARPVKGPASWQELNERQSPDHKGGSE